MLTLVRLAISGLRLLRLLRLFMHRLVRFAVSDGYGNAISCDCPDVLRSANFRRGEPGKPQLIVRRAPPVPSFRITHCLAGLVRSVILFYPFIYLAFYVVLMFYNVICIMPYSTDINNFIIRLAHKEIHKLTWISPNQRDKKQTDHLLISDTWRQPLQDVRFRSGVDVSSNHHLVVAHIKLKLKGTVTPIRLLKWFNVSKLKDAGISPVVQY